MIIRLCEVPNAELANTNWTEGYVIPAELRRPQLRPVFACLVVTLVPMKVVETEAHIGLAIGEYPTTKPSSLRGPFQRRYICCSQRRLW